MYRDIPVYYSVEGEGPALLFVHGYLEAAEIWESFSTLFTGSFRVICPDIPGHGSSGTWGETHKMEELADVLALILDAEQVDKCVIFGHSMGGYVAMAFAEAYEERLLGLALVHSTCFADSEEKKENREREIALVKCGKKQQIINVNIPRAFASSNLETLPGELERAKTIALQTPDQGIIALLNGMKDRKDHTLTLQSLRVPVLLVAGDKDNYIPSAITDKLAALVPGAMVVRLKYSGHMGFVEEPAAMAKAVNTYLSTI